MIYLNDTPSTDLSIAVKKVTAQLSRFSNIWIHSTYKSFYESLFPEQSVDIMLSSIAIHWLPKVPSEIDALYCVLTKDLTSTEEGKIWEKSAAESLNGFLIERDKELRPEGLLIIIVPSMMDPPNKNDLVSIDCISAWKSCLQKSLSKYTLTYEKEYYLPLVIRSIKHFNSVFETDPKIKLKLVRSAYKLNELFPLGEDLQKNSIVYGNWLKGYSEEVLKTAMKQKGIDENLIEKVLSDFYNKEVPEHAIQDGLLMNPILVTTLLLFIQK